MARPGSPSLPEILAVAAALEHELAEACDAFAAATAGNPAVGAILQTIAGDATKRAETLSSEARALGAETSLAREELLQALPDIKPEPPPDEPTAANLYRALAWIVAHEQQAFRAFSYLAAHAGDAAVGRRAEALAQTKLTSAAQLRRQRRHAYHVDRQAGRADPRALARRVEDSAGLRDAARALESAIADCLADEVTPASAKAGQLTSELLATLGTVRESDASLTAALAALVERDSSGNAALAALDRAFMFYDAVLSRADSDAMLVLAQRLMQVSLDRIELLRGRGAVNG